MEVTRPAGLRTIEEVEEQMSEGSVEGVVDGVEVKATGAVADKMGEWAIGLISNCIRDDCG